MGVVIPLEESKNKQASVKPLVDLTKSGMERVNQLILSKAGSDVQMIPEVANHLISSGGKRLRPMLTLATASMFGYEGDHHIKLATAVEFMHTATLLHDDVVDESDLRRGKSTARTIWGNQASVLVGDFLLGQAFRMMVDVGSLDALDVLRATSRRGDLLVELVAAVGAKAEVHNIIRSLAGQGVAVFVISSDLPEVLALADRVGVIVRGRIVATFDAPAERQAVGRAMVTGATRPLADAVRRWVRGHQVFAVLTQGLVLAVRALQAAAPATPDAPFTNPKACSPSRAAATG